LLQVLKLESFPNIYITPNYTFYIPVYYSVIVYMYVVCLFSFCEKALTHFDILLLWILTF